MDFLAAYRASIFAPIHQFLVTIAAYDMQILLISTRHMCDHAAFNLRVVGIEALVHANGTLNSFSYLFADSNHVNRRHKHAERK